MKLLITGICGFVGSSLAKAWVEAGGHTIYGIDNLIRAGSHINSRSLKELGVRVVHGDVRCASDFEALPAVDYLIDAAANPSVLGGIDSKCTSRQMVEHNLCGTVNMLEYCKAHRAGMILLSSSRVYSIKPLASLALEPVAGAFRPSSDCVFPVGVTENGITEQFSTAAPVSLLGASKLASEVLALEYANAFDLPIWINRCGVLAGAGQFGHAEQGIISYWLNTWSQRQPLKYIGFGGTGHQVRDVLHPRDLVCVLDQQIACTTPTVHRVLNVAGGIQNAISLRNLSAWCADRFGHHDVGVDSSERPFDIPWMVLDTSRANETWGWQPSVELSEILSEIAEFAERNPDWLNISIA